MRRKFDIDVVTEVLSGEDVREKIEMLEELQYQLPEWDIFPVQMILAGMFDKNAGVRALTFSLLTYCPEELSQEDLLAVLRLIEDCGEDVRRQIVEEVSVFARCIESETLKLVLPFLSHRNGDVRDTAVQVFTELSHRFTDEMFLRVAEAYSNENVDIRDSIAEFLERNGQGALITI